MTTQEQRDIEELRENVQVLFNRCDLLVGINQSLIERLMKAERIIEDLEKEKECIAKVLSAVREAHNSLAYKSFSIYHPDYGQYQVKIRV